MAFKLFTVANDQSSAALPMPKTVSGTAMNKGDLLMWDVSNNGLARATSSTTTLTGAAAVAQSTQAAADATVQAIMINSSQIWLADSTNNSSASHNGQRMTLTDHSAVNNTGTDVSTFAGKAICRQVGVVGAASDKKILVQFFPVTTLTA